MAIFQRSSLKTKNTTVPVYAFTDDTDRVADFFLYDGTSTTSLNDSLGSSSDIADNLSYITVDTPDTDGIVCGIYAGQPISFILGEPTDRYFVFFTGTTEQTIPYEHFSTSAEAIADGNLTELQNGFYITPFSTDDAYSFIRVDGEPFLVKTALPGQDTVQSMNGVIKLENNNWQLISIPKQGAKVKEYFADRLATKYSLAADEMIEICGAYFGDENKFRSYIPGVTNASSANNFPLVYNDDGKLEITGFWVKLKDLSGKVDDVNNITISWDT